MTQRLGSARVRLSTALVVAWMMLIAQSASALASATDQRLDEYSVRAAFLLNLTKFVQWPSGDPLVFCITGDDVFAISVKRVVDRRATDGRDISVLALGPKDDFTRCRLLFVGHFAARHTTAILKQIEGLPVLTVSDSDSFLNEGGNVRVFVENNRIRFQISGSSAEKQSLKISSQLLSLATR